MNTPNTPILRTQALALAWSLLAPAAACAKAPEATVQASRSPMDASTHATLFELIDDLAKNRPLRVSSLSERLGLSFKEDRASSNAYFHIYQAHGPAKRAGGAVVGAELREPAQAPKEGSVNGLLILEINKQTCVSQEEIRQRFGANPELTIPSPHGPADAPVYWVYRQAWGKLNFGFSRSEPACLVGVTIDAIPDS